MTEQEHHVLGYEVRIADYCFLDKRWYLLWILLIIFMEIPSG